MPRRHDRGPAPVPSPAQVEFQRQWLARDISRMGYDATFAHAAADVLIRLGPNLGRLLVDTRRASRGMGWQKDDTILRWAGGDANRPTLIVPVWEPTHPDSGWTIICGFAEWDVALLGVTFLVEPPDVARGPYPYERPENDIIDRYIAEHTEGEIEEALKARARRGGLDVP